MKARYTTFEIASKLNIKIFPCVVKSLILHAFLKNLNLSSYMIFLLQAFYCKKSVFPESQQFVHLS